MIDKVAKRTHIFFIFIEAHALRDYNANKSNARFITKKLKQTMTRKDEEILISRRFFENKLLLLKHTSERI